MEGVHIFREMTTWTWGRSSLRPPQFYLRYSKVRGHKVRVRGQVFTVSVSGP